MRTNELWRRAVVAACASVWLAVPVLADWNAGDSCKMHFPQMPDPAGWDVCLIDQFLADDFVCSQSGPITDIHFWTSWRSDLIGEIKSLDIRICGPGQVANVPGPVLWTWSGMGNVRVRLASLDTLAPRSPYSPFGILLVLFTSE
jgi:hypothetical protein